MVHKLNPNNQIYSNISRLSPNTDVENQGMVTETSSLLHGSHNAQRADCESKLSFCVKFSIVIVIILIIIGLVNSIVVHVNKPNTQSAISGFSKLTIPSFLS